jgi:membrane AbrB-like protein
MRLEIPSSRELLHVAETLLIAVLGGVGLALVGFPAGLVSGSIMAVAIAAVLGRPTKVPLSLTRVCFVLVGILLGAVVTPETLRGVATWPLSVALLAFATICMLVATATYLRYVHRWDSLSAVLGASPGSMAQVIVLAAEFGADMRGIAIVQTMRVLVVAIGLPGSMALFGLAAGSIIVVPGPPGGSSVWELALIGAVSAALAYLMARIRFPGGILFGSMAGSGILHGTGLVHAVLPWWLGSAAVVVLGAVVGARFANTTPRILLDYVWAALGSATVAMAVAAGFVLVVTNFLPFRTADVVIAFAPGAQDTMMVLALALHLDPVYVGTHHLARWLVVTFLVAFAAKRAERRRPAHEVERWKRPGQGTFDD